MLLSKELASGTFEQLEDSRERTRSSKPRLLATCATTATAGFLHGATSRVGLGGLWVSRHCREQGRPDFRGVETEVFVDLIAQFAGLQPRPFRTVRQAICDSPGVHGGTVSMSTLRRLRRNVEDPDVGPECDAETGSTRPTGANGPALS